VTASVVLLISAGLLMRALLRVQSTDPGFRTEGVMTMRTALPTPKYDSVFTRQRFYTHVLTNVRALPGVTNAAYSSFLPIVMGGGIWTVDIAGETYAPGEKPHVSMRFLTPGYFSSMSIPLKAGRDVSESDAADQPFVAVVSESFAREHWPQSSALGKSFRIASSERTVVGVVGDVRVRGLEKESEPQVYLPYRQVDDGSMSFYVPKDLVVRTSGAPQSLLPSIRRIVREADPQQPISNVQTLEQIVSDETASRAVQLRVLGAFALIAVLLAGIGIHGLLSFTVSQRRHEIGVRLALGAQSSTIVRMVMRQGAILAIVGVIPGVALAYVAGRTMQALLAGVQPTDALTVSVAVSVCVVTALLGTLLPVMRAVKVAPASAFRGE
jgi:predicted permease